MSEYEYSAVRSENLADMREKLMTLMDEGWNMIGALDIFEGDRTAFIFVQPVKREIQ